MRNILVNHVVSRGRQKRGGGKKKVPLADVVVLFEERALGLPNLTIKRVASSSSAFSVA